MAQENHARLDGRFVSLAENHGPLKPCRACACESGVIHTRGGETPSLYCATCGDYLGLLSRAHVAAFLAISDKGTAA